MQYMNVQYYNLDYYSNYTTVKDNLSIIFIMFILH